MKLYIKSSKLSHDVNEYQEWIDYDMKHYGRISKETRDEIKKAGFTVTRDQYGDYEVTAAEDIECSELSKDFDEYQKWIDYDMKRYGRISDKTMREIKKAGFTVTRDEYGDYEVTAAEDVECAHSPRPIDFYKAGKKSWATTDLRYVIRLNKHGKYELFEQTSNAPNYDFLTTKLYFDTLEEAEDYVLQNFYDLDIEAVEGVECDTVKKGNKWVNRGDTGEEHGEFKTKKEADAQRRAMFAKGLKR